LVGRKPKSYDMGPFIRIVLPVFQLSAILPKKEYFFTQVYEEDFPAVKEKMLKEGYKNIKAVQNRSTYVPRRCPLCNERGGHPNLQRDERVRTLRDENFRKGFPKRFKLYYNHSKPKYRQCFIGYLIGGYWKVSERIDPRKMYPDYNDTEDKREWFPMPKFRKPRKLS